MPSSYHSGAYYKNNVFPLINRSRCFSCDNSLNFEIHILTCERDVLFSVWALKTFCLSIGKVPPIAIHDDGSLSAESYKMLGSHFKNARIISDTDVSTNTKFQDQILPFPLIQYWRLEADIPLARRVIDFPFFASKDFIISIDSDVLFFKRSDCVQHLIEQNIPFICEDYQSAYTPSLLELRDKGAVIDEKINAGFFGLQKKVFSLQWIECFLKTHTDKPWFPWSDGWLEQTIIAGLITRCAEKQVLDRRLHSLSFDRIHDQTCSHHFVGDGSRALYFSIGLRHLHQCDVLRELGVFDAVDHAE